MKKNIILYFSIIIPVLCFLIAAAMNHSVHGAEPDYPSPAGYVNDFAKVISSDDSRFMSDLIQELKDKTKAEVAVVALPTIGEETIETYAVKLFEKWKLGEKGKDTGILILLAIKERKIKIEVGYGLEGVIPDGLAGQIIDQAMIPSLKAGDFSAGLKNGTIAVVRLIAQEYKVKIEGAVRKNTEETKINPLEVLFLLVFGIFFIIGNRRRRRSRGGYGGYWGGGFGGGGGGGFGGGGFGGFGGGFSGGGGASRGF